MNTFLGTSVAFPIRPNGRGGIAIGSGVAAVEDSLRAIISSMRGSHLFEPWLGTPTRSLDSYYATRLGEAIDCIGTLIRNRLAGQGDWHSLDFESQRHAPHRTAGVSPCRRRPVTTTAPRLGMRKTLDRQSKRADSQPPPAQSTSGQTDLCGGTAIGSAHRRAEVRFAGGEVY